MTLPSRDIRYDVASAVSRGARDHQEDALIADFPIGSDIGFAVLSDGMGGHTAGDIASKIIVTEVFSELKFQCDDENAPQAGFPSILLEAVTAANECVKYHIGTNPRTRGMGATLVAPVFFKDRLFWISVGDSPLFLFRNGKLKQLNQDHSMAPQIDLLVRSGVIAPEEGQNHPDRNCLTSVLMGGEIAQIDCPQQAVKLFEGDVLIVASDGLQFLSDEEISDILSISGSKSSSEIAKKLLGEIERLADPDQDNVSFIVVKIGRSGNCPETRPVRHAVMADAVAHSGVDSLAVDLPATARRPGPAPIKTLQRSLAARGNL